MSFLKPEDVEQFLNEVRVEVIGASDAGIKLALNQTVKEFLADSNAWREDVSLNVVANTQNYKIIVREGGQIIRLISVLDGFRTPVAANMPSFGDLIVRTQINVTSVEQAASDTSLKATTPWVVTVAKNVVLPTTKDAIPLVPDFVLRVYGNWITDGVLGRMLSQNGKSWSNLALGKYHLQRFREGVNTARDEASTQNTMGGQRWVYPRRFAGISSQRNYSTIWPKGA